MVSTLPSVATQRLKDHHGSASVLTDASGNVLGENRYYAFGETRWSTGTILTDKLFTGQRAMTDLGIYHYGARFYSPKIGRFLSADTIVPNPANPQDYNRYAYVRNNPVRYIDPSGHVCSDPDNPNRSCENGNPYPNNTRQLPGGDRNAPDEVDFSLLTQANENREYSGSMMYQLYLAAWRANGGNLTIKQFVTYMLAYEFQPYNNLEEDFISTLKTAAGNWFWCSPNADTNTCTNLRDGGGATNEALLNWVAGMESARRRYDNVFIHGGDPKENVFGGPMNLPLATDVIDFVLYESKADGHLYLNQPFHWANLSLPLNPDILYASQGSAYNQYLRVFGSSNPAYILSPCQTAFRKGETGYYDICGIP